MRAVTPEGRQLASVKTDAYGRYEIVGLPLGKYTLRAVKGPFVSLQLGERTEFDAPTTIDLVKTPSVEKADFALPRGAAISGTVVDELGDPFLGARVTAYRFRYVRGRRQLVSNGSSMTDDLGQFRVFGLSAGDYTVAASTRVQVGTTSQVGNPGIEDSGYALTYAPGTTNVSETDPIALTAGRSATHVEIALVPSRVARLEGVLVDSGGQPLSYGVVNLSDRLTNSNVAIGQVHSDGSFAISDVPPGEYFLKSDTVTAGSDGVPQVARLAVTVRGENVIGLRLSPLASVVVGGRIEVDPLARSSPVLTTVKAEIIRMLEDGLSELRPLASPVARDNSFQLRTFVGAVKVTLAGLAPGWTIRAVRTSSSTDVTDGIDLGPSQLPYELTVEITDQFPRITGTVSNSRGDVVSDCNVLVFSKDSNRWGWNSRYVILGAPSAEKSAFELGPLPPGEYYAIAVPRFRDDQWADVDYLETLSGRAKAVTLFEGRSLALNLVLQAVR